MSGGEEGRAARSCHHARRESRRPGPWSSRSSRRSAAKADDGTPCCEWVGTDGAGHFVKMVHNGIEYGDMQMICEAYFLMERVLGMTPDEMHTGLHRVEQGRAEQLPDRDHQRHPGQEGPGDGQGHWCT